MLMIVCSRRATSARKSDFVLFGLAALGSKKTPAPFSLLCRPTGFSGQISAILVSYLAKRKEEWHNKKMQPEFKANDDEIGEINRKQKETSDRPTGTAGILNQTG